MNSVLFVIETMMQIMQEYPSLISRRGDIQVLPCASLRARLTPRRNKELSPGSNTKDQGLEDTSEKQNFSLGTPVESLPSALRRHRTKVQAFSSSTEIYFKNNHWNLLKYSEILRKVTALLILWAKLKFTPPYFLLGWGETAVRGFCLESKLWGSSFQNLVSFECISSIITFDPYLPRR